MTAAVAADALGSFELAPAARGEAPAAAVDEGLHLARRRRRHWNIMKSEGRRRPVSTAAAFIVVGIGETDSRVALEC